MNIEYVQKFISENHEKIEGWFFGLDQVAFYDLFVMQNSLGISGDICEVGVYKGKSLTFLSLLKAPQERIFGFDLFESDHQDLAVENIEKFGDKAGISLVKGPTSNIDQTELDAMISSPLRFLHIDAGHEYHEVLEQLYLFCPYVSDQGIIAMDDYQDREFPGIEAAVLDYSEHDRPRRFVPFLAGGNKMYMCASPIATLLQGRLLEHANLKDRCRLTRVRDFNILVMGSKLPISSEQIKLQLGAFKFPHRGDHHLSLNEKSSRYAQISFGSGSG